MITWTDATSYAHGQRGKKEPTTWKTNVEGLMEITVVYGHIYHPTCWVFHCFELRWDTVPLPGVKTAAEAQMKALEMVRYKLEKLHTALISQWPGK